MSSTSQGARTTLKRSGLSANDGAMTRRLPLQVRRAAAWWARQRALILRCLLLLGVVLAPVGAPAALTELLNDDGCGQACPCADEVTVIDLSADLGLSPDPDAPLEQAACADDCADCSCCLGAFVALSPDPGILPRLRPDRDARIASHDPAPQGVRLRVFRPPQGAPV